MYKIKIGLVGITFSTDLSLSFVVVAEYYLKIASFKDGKSVFMGDISKGQGSNHVFNSSNCESVLYIILQLPKNFQYLL
jgi:hypothetical protein